MLHFINIIDNYKEKKTIERSRFQSLLQCPFNVRDLLLKAFNRFSKIAFSAPLQATTVFGWRTSFKNLLRFQLNLFTFMSNSFMRVLSLDYQDF